MTMAAPRLRLGRAVRRADGRLRDRHLVDLTTESANAHASPISLPITQSEVKLIASAGFPLWEPLETLQLRNHRITLAYGDLSRQLSRLTAGDDDEREWNANWCTFATWSSRTIGTCIDRQPEHGLIHQSPERTFRHHCAASSMGFQKLSCAGGTELSTGRWPSATGWSSSRSAPPSVISSSVSMRQHERILHNPNFEAYWSDVHTFLTGNQASGPQLAGHRSPGPRDTPGGNAGLF